MRRTFVRFWRSPGERILSDSSAHPGLKRARYRDGVLEAFTPDLVQEAPIPVEAHKTMCHRSPVGDAD